jgi:hypothetical protein
VRLLGEPDRPARIPMPQPALAAAA